MGPDKDNGWVTTISSDGLTVYYVDNTKFDIEYSLKSAIVTLELKAEETSEAFKALYYGTFLAGCETETPSVSNAPVHVSGCDTMAILNEAIPGFSEMKVKYPGKRFTGHEVALEPAIIALNDSEGWTREQIADWLETLDLDLTIRG